MRTRTRELQQLPLMLELRVLLTIIYLFKERTELKVAEGGPCALVIGMELHTRYEFNICKKTGGQQIIYSVSWDDGGLRAGER